MSRKEKRPITPSRNPHSCLKTRYLPLQNEAAAALFQVITQRYLKSSTILTTNLGIASWGQIFDDPMVAAAMLDRLLHRSVVFNNSGTQNLW